MRGGGVCWDMTSTCVQSGLPRPLGGYQPNVIMEPHSPAPAWNMHQSVVPKQEPMDEDRNDSGITSGSDHSSSPGSDNSQDYNPSYASGSTASASTYYSTPQTSIRPNFGMFHMGFNPLTPPSSEPLVSPKPLKIEPTEDCNTTLTPHASPTLQTAPTSQESPKTPVENPLRQLQMTFEKNGLLPMAISPKTNSEHSGDEEKQLWEDSEEGVRVPSVNSHGKVKTFKCKQCDFVAVTKMDFWEHSRAHIKTDKILTCPKCPFVTEYKHHLEYHLRNHFGSKPFKCEKCSYSCVNKSMLNSHMKSHSNVYQYRCQDCSYATKYCHSLKLHLRKYRHQPAMVLNPDGTPNPLPIIDVYGTRRGPKIKQMKGEQQNVEAIHQTSVPSIPLSSSTIPLSTPPQNLTIPQNCTQNSSTHQNSAIQHSASIPQNSTPVPIAQMNCFASMMNFPGQLPFPYHFFPQQLLLAQQLAAQNEVHYSEASHKDAEGSNNDAYNSEISDSHNEAQNALNEAQNEDSHSEKSTSPLPLIPETILEEEVDSSGALDLTKPEVIQTATKNRRKGKAFKLERPTVMVQQPMSDEETEHKLATPSPPPVTPSAADCTCRFCGIAFGDVVLYTMHMGYHGYKDPFTCNMCGEQCNDKVAFFLHIARNPHT